MKQWSPARTMTDMIAAPKSNIVADRREGLAHVAFEDEGVVTDVRIVEHGRVGADEAREQIAPLSPQNLFFPQPVELGTADRHEHTVHVWWIDFGHLFKGDNRQAAEASLLQEGGTPKRQRPRSRHELGDVADAEDD
jgi:hypothetical protein